jgi:hypothetical protein
VPEVGLEALAVEALELGHGVARVEAPHVRVDALAP